MKTSVGQVTLLPVQLSSTSQSPAAGRQVVVEVLKPVVQTPPWQLSGSLQSPLDPSPQAVPFGAFCVTSVSVQNPGEVHWLPPIVQVIVASFEQRSAQTFTLHGSLLGTGIQAPASTPQLHFDVVPALTSVEPVQAISSALWAQVSQW